MWSGISLEKVFYMCSLILMVLVCIWIDLLHDGSLVTTKINLSFRMFGYWNAANSPMLKVSPKRLVKDVNCAAILNGDKLEITKAKHLMSRNFSKIPITEEDYIQMTSNCDIFRSSRGYDNIVTSIEEIEFPIAYSILLYKDVEQAERLLRAIYAPQNYFCLHIDANSEKAIHDAMQGIADCFDNVFVVSRKEYIVYAGFTRLQADINCMENLLQIAKDWKYFINLPSQEFPLKTNREIVKILTIYNGANDIEGLTGMKTLKRRYKHRFIYNYTFGDMKPKLYKTEQIKLESPPYNITIIKGSAYGIFSRAFVHFVINNKIPRALLDWMRDVYSPDEYYWATLNFNHHIGTPGAYYRGKPDKKPWLAAFVLWSHNKMKCQGKVVRSICVFGVGDPFTPPLCKQIPF